jgi:hypothetical protein
MAIPLFHLAKLKINNFQNFPNVRKKPQAGEHRRKVTKFNAQTNQKALKRLKHKNENSKRHYNCPSNKNLSFNFQFSEKGEGRSENVCQC